jgi:uncharacterized protein YjiK
MTLMRLFKTHIITGEIRGVDRMTFVRSDPMQKRNMPVMRKSSQGIDLFLTRSASADRIPCRWLRLFSLSVISSSSCEETVGLMSRNFPFVAHFRLPSAVAGACNCNGSDGVGERRIPAARPMLRCQGWMAVLAVCGVLGATADEPVTAPNRQNLRLIGEYRLKIPEPSGLSLAHDRASLWAVSDRDGRAYQISLRGEVLKSFATGLPDLEGVAVVDAETVAVVSERDRKIAVFTTGGRRLRGGRVDISGKDNKGPEGLAYSTASGHFFVVREKPGMLIELDAKFNEVRRERLRFAKDYSSISHEPDRDRLWVMSDQSKSIHVIDHTGAIQASYTTNIQQMEGLAVDHQSRRLYVVSDPLSMLYVFEFSEAAD